MLLQTTLGNVVTSIAEPVIAAALVGIGGLVIKLAAGVRRVETILSEPANGVLPTLQRISATVEAQAVVIGRHDERLDGHDREIRDLKRPAYHPHSNRS